MGRFSFFSILPFLSVLLSINGIPEVTPTRKGIATHLPTTGDLKPLKSFGPREVYKAEALYLWIDGGASIYFEYGFEQAVTEQYMNPDSQTITLELYEMTDPTSAYGIYTFKKASTGSPVPVGSEGWMEDYYLNCWKGNFLLTVIASDSDDRLMEDLLRIAEVVAARIPEEGTRPTLIDLLPTADLDSASIKYLEGPLALLGSYSFTGDNIFGLTKGTVADYGDVRLFIFKYKDAAQSLGWFSDARRHLEEEGNIHTSDARTGAFSLVDSAGRHVHLKSYQEYILIQIGPEETNTDTLFEAVEAKIGHSASPERR